MKSGRLLLEAWPGLLSGTPGKGCLNPQLLGSIWPHAAQAGRAMYSSTKDDDKSQPATASSTAADHSKTDEAGPTTSAQVPRQGHVHAQPSSSSSPSAAAATSKRTARAAAQSLPSTSAAAAIARNLMAHFDTADTAAEGKLPQSGSRPRRRGQHPGAAQAQTLAPDNLEPTLDVLAMVVRAVENCKPSLKVKQFRDGNRVTSMPYMVHPREQTSLAVRWILQAAQKRRLVKGVRPSMAEALATELLLAAQKQGSARARMEEMHRLAVENRAAVQRTRAAS